MSDKIYSALIWFVLLFLLTSCSGGHERKSFIQLRNIIKEANSRLDVEYMEDISKGDIVTGTIVEFKKTRSIEYLKRNEEKLKVIYFSVEKHISEKDDFYGDSLYVLALTGIFMHFFTGEVLGGTCNYLNEINKKEGVTPSPWIQDNFFAPLLTNQQTIESWEQLSAKEKSCKIQKYIMVRGQDLCSS